MPDNGSYFSRTFAIIKKDPKWYLTVLICGLGMLVPFLGQICVNGYMLEWGRLVAWGADTPPKREGTDFGTCLSSGFRAFVVSLGYGLIVGGLFILLMFIPLVNVIVIFLMIPIALAAGIVIEIAQLRATIYQSFDSGYNFKRIKELVNRDTSGLLKIVLMIVVVGVVFVICMFVLMMPLGILQGDAEDGISILSLLSSAIASIGAAFVWMIFHGAVALWMRQFNVPAWGDQSDPLPPMAAPTYGYQQDYGQVSAYGQQPMGYQDPQAYAAQQQPVGYQDPQAYATQQPMTDYQQGFAQPNAYGQPMPVSQEPQMFMPQQEASVQQMYSPQAAPTQQEMPVAFPIENVAVEVQTATVSDAEAPVQEEKTADVEPVIQTEAVEVAEPVEAIVTESVEAAEAEVTEAEPEPFVVPEPEFAVEFAPEPVVVPEPEIAVEPVPEPELAVEEAAPEPEAEPEAVVIEPIVIEDTLSEEDQPTTEADEKDAPEE